MPEAKDAKVMIEEVWLAMRKMVVRVALLHIGSLSLNPCEHDATLKKL